MKPNTFYEGHYIHLKVDKRWISHDTKKEYYNAKLFTKNSVLIRMPTADFDALYNRDSMSGLDQNEIDAMDNARHDFIEAEKAETNAGFKYLLLKFPSDEELSAQAIYAGASEDEKLELKGLPCQSTYGTSRDVYSEGFVTWTVARMEIAPISRARLPARLCQSLKPLLLLELCLELWSLVRK